DFDQSGKSDRLGDIGVDTEVVCARNVLFGFRCGQHDDGNGAEFGIVLDFAKRLAAVLAWQVKVQQDQYRPRRLLRVGEFAAAAKIIEQFLTVFDAPQIADQAAFFHRLPREQAV